MSHFEMDTPFLWLLPLLFAALVLVRRRHKEPDVGYSHLASLRGESLRARLAWLPTALKFLSLALLVVALASPGHLTEEFDESSLAQEEGQESDEELILPREGIGLYFVLDRSGSMNEETEVALAGGGRRRMQRIEMLKWLTRAFIQGDQDLGLSGRYSDMIGLVAFARVAQVISPLTLNHRTVLDELQKLAAVRYQAENGTALGYALFKTVNLIAATEQFDGESPYDLKSSVIVMITDGFPTPHPLDAHHELRTIDLLDAAKYSAHQGVRLYLINVEPQIRLPQYRSYLDEQKMAAEVTGGRFFIADRPEAMKEIYTEIDTLERSNLPQPLRIDASVEELFDGSASSHLRRSRWTPYLVVFALVLLGSGLLLESTLFRRVP